MSDTADPNMIYDMYGSGFPANVLRVALQLDLFTPLSGGPADAGTVASAVGAHPGGTRALLDYLVSAGLLGHDAAKYEITDVAATFLLPGRPTYAGDFILQHSSPVVWDAVLDALRGRRPVRTDFAWEQDAWLESYRSDRPAASREMWNAAGVTAVDERQLRVLDLGSGCAVKSLVLAVDYSARVTAVDSSAVLTVARDLARRLGVEKEIDLVPGDALTVDLATSAYDAALVGQLTYYLDPPTNTSLFRRVREALVPGGRLVIDAIMLADDPSRWASTVTLLSLGTADGTAHSFVDYQSWLMAAGFRDIRQLTEHSLVASTSPDIEGEM